MRLRMFSEFLVSFLLPLFSLKKMYFLFFVCFSLFSPNQGQIVVSTCSDLMNISNNLSASYVLSQNIACSNFTAIQGTFTGSFDGQYFSISNPTFNGDDLLLFCCGLKVNTIFPPWLCVKFPEITILDPEEMFKFALLFKFPSTSVVVFPLKTISPVFVSVPLFGMNVHLHSFWKKTHETFPWVNSNTGALKGQR